MPLLTVDHAELMRWITSLMWPFVRIGALLLAAPLFGARTVPVRVRVGLALVLAYVVAYVVAPTLPAEVAGVDPLSLPGAFVAAREALIGAVMGFLLQMVFGAMAMGGEIVALSMGLAFASVVDPERGASVPLVGQYFVVFATLLFLAFDGHLALLVLLLDSFTLLPPSPDGFGAAGLWEVATWGSEMFRAAVLVALPASAALLVASVSMGMIARSAPQLNIFAVGFPLTLMLGLVLLALGLDALAPQLESILETALLHARDTLGAAR
ncbi:MAG: flagellar biosynthetic protein FliR [Gammaproteobacteria bacterium]|nr:flagellar biosynthetic protein FliR [Gammaproteobacteria bacterium]